MLYMKTNGQITECGCNIQKCWGQRAELGARYRTYQWFTKKNQTRPHIHAMSRIYYGTFVHALGPSTLQFLEDTALLVSDAGVISRIEPSTLPLSPNLLSLSSYPPVVLGPDEFFIPGFIDTHVHAPQYVYAGAGTDVPLMMWLEKYAFPAEQQMRVPAYARDVYGKLVDRTLRNGTTTAMYFATIDVEPCMIFAEILKEKGQRGFVGKVCMDRNSPASYIETTDESLERAEEFIRQIQAMHHPLLTPVITPRFIPTCTPELLKGLGDLARKHNVPVQSHLSESKDEVAFVSSLHPGEGTDTAIFERAGLLTQRTVMAHSIYLTSEDTQILVEKGCGLAVCPISNYFFAGDSFPVKERMDAGLKCGLGTDIAGGYSPSILQNIRTMVMASRARNNRNPEAGVVDYKCGFYLATRGGAEVLGLKDIVGGFNVGMQFDACRVRLGGGGPVDVFDGEDWERKFEKFVNLSDDRNFVEVYVAGRRVV
ncbi:hypothetical protein HKX48_008815 [Thoreauomyces humboldtii]|nr:hypothetical protein HKX48_008815 [Thoreauomyces humboldtii]